MMYITLPVDVKRRVTVNVSGTCNEIPYTYLGKFGLNKLLENHVAMETTGERMVFTVDRPAECFGAILSYIQTGELHMPPGVCPGAFKRELEYWNVDSHALKSCCLYKYQSFLDEENTRHKFLEKGLVSSNQNNYTKLALTSFGRFRIKLWNLVNNDEVSIPSRVYFTVISLMVMLSILALALSTEPELRRAVSECELLEYLQYNNDPDIEKFKFAMDYPDCSGSVTLSSGEDPMDVTSYNLLVYTHPDGTMTHTLPTGAPNPLGSLKKFNPADKMLRNKYTLSVPELTVPKYGFYIVDMILILFFTLDVVLRVLSCPFRRHYFCSAINVFDLLALAGSYSSLIVISVERQYRYVKTPWLQVLNFLLVFRALRLFRVVKNVRASKVLAYSLTQNGKDMGLLVLLLFIGISAFACLFFFSEPRDVVESIPVAWYWAIITMTTVGYGDISPTTKLGRGLAAICAVCGVLLLAITLPMFVNNFLSLYQYSCVNDSIVKEKSARDNENRVVPLAEHGPLDLYNESGKQQPHTLLVVKPIDDDQKAALY